MNITSENFIQHPKGETSKLFTLTNDRNITVKITNLGGSIISLVTPDRSNNLSDILLGFENVETWVENPPYFNCIVGRTCNRIGGASFEIDKIRYDVSANMGKNQLHGGFEGFNKKLWQASIIKNEESVGLQLDLLSPDGDEGFPGNVKVSCVYLLNNENEFSMEFIAFTDKATPINITNHAYFNLRGEGNGNIYDTKLTVFADKITSTDEDSIPDGEFISIKNTPFDFTAPRTIGERISDLDKGYDNNYVLRNQQGTLSLAAKAFDDQTGRVIEVYTTEPGMQLYTSNWFDGTLIGKCGKPHLTHSAFCLETQHFPDSMNRPEFPSVIYRPGEVFKSTTVWKFSVE